MSTAPLPGSRWFRFSLSTLLVLVTVCCVGFCWLEWRLRVLRECAPRPLSKTATLNVYVLCPAGTPSSKPATDPFTKAPIFLKTPAVLSAADVATIQRSPDSNAQTFTVNLTPTGAMKLGAATAKTSGMQLAIEVNGAIVALPRVMTTISTPIEMSGGPELHRQFFEALTK